jgi:hypothetical protein
VPKGPKFDKFKTRKGLVQGLPLGRKLSQFFGRTSPQRKRVSHFLIFLAVVILIMTSPKGPETLKFFQGIFLIVDLHLLNFSQGISLAL